MTDPTHSELRLYIDGAWRQAGDRGAGAVLNPATGQEIGRVPFATIADLDDALAAADRAFRKWRKTPAVQRAAILHKAAGLIRERHEAIARLLTLEEGKPLRESRLEVLITADILDWAAEEGRRAYGRLIPHRLDGVEQLVVKEPIGPAASFTPWNAPVLLTGRKIAEALAAGCTCIVKPAEEAPASSLEVARALDDAGLPPGVCNVVFGVPSEVSTHLIRSPIVRKVSFTGSVEVGRVLGRLAGENVKPITLELGGHAPVIVFGDCEVDKAAELAVAAKLRNCGQVCGSPTRFLVEEPVYERFLGQFSERMRAARIGSGFDDASDAGPMANFRRIAAMERITADAEAHGAKVEAGGRRIGNQGFFWSPTVVSGVPLEADIMNREPFGPIAVVSPFAGLEQAVGEANRLPYGLAAYAFTGSARTAQALREEVECGLIGLNTFAVNFPETPFGGIKESGYGSEGGAEGVAAYLVSKYVARG